MISLGRCKVCPSTPHRTWNRSSFISNYWISLEAHGEETVVVFIMIS